MFKNPKQSFTNEELLIQCCDTALDDLTDDKVSKDIRALDTQGYVKNPLTIPSIQEPPSYQITGKGILYVRKDMLKPIQDFVQRSDVDPIINYVRNPIAKEFIEIRNDTFAENNGEFDKRSFNQKITDYAINNIAPIAEVIPKLIEALKMFH